MEIRTEEAGPYMLIFIDDPIRYQKEEIGIKTDDNCLPDIWNDVCRKIFGSHLTLGRNFVTMNYCIWYKLSKIKFIANKQRHLFLFTTLIANWEIGRTVELFKKKEIKDGKTNQLRMDL
jgi:hypothetical protein